MAARGGRTSGAILWAFPAFLAALAALMLAQNMVAAALAMAGLGCFYEICRTGSLALLQTSVPDALRGRVMSTQFLLLRLAGAFGVAAIGAAAEGWGLRLPILCCVGVAVLAWGATFRSRKNIAATFAARA